MTADLNGLFEIQFASVAIGETVCVIIHINPCFYFLGNLVYEPLRVLEIAGQSELFGLERVLTNCDFESVVAEDVLWRDECGAGLAIHLVFIQLLKEETFIAIG